MGYEMRGHPTQRLELLLKCELRRSQLREMRRIQAVGKLCTCQPLSPGTKEYIGKRQVYQLIGFILLTSSLSHRFNSILVFQCPKWVTSFYFHQHLIVQ